MSVDFEEWFHGLSSTGQRPENWCVYEERIDIGADFLLETFRSTGIRSTFFIVGKLAERRPDLVRRISDEGHEVALHGHWHKYVWDFEPNAFAEDIVANLDAIRRSYKGQVCGFRAPSFSVKTDMKWVWEKLADCGIEYSSSLFPIRTPLYGSPDAPQHLHRRGKIFEVPISTYTTFNTRIPFSGGFYFRALPYKFVRHCTQKMNQQGKPVVFYFHPWEFDKHHPKPSGISVRERISHYTGLRSARTKLLRLCNDFEFAPLQSLLDNSSVA